LLLQLLRLSPNQIFQKPSGDAVELAEMSARDVRTSSKNTTVEAE